MKRSVAFLTCLALLGGCGTLPRNDMIERKEMKTLGIRWQRLVDDKGETCDRCGATETAVEDAVQKLKRSLRELDIDIILDKTTLDPDTFKKDPLQSNRIWIANKPLEDWLAATIGQSQCCSTCGDSDCRTVTVDGKTHEATTQLTDEQKSRLWERQGTIFWRDPATSKQDARGASISK